MPALDDHPGYRRLLKLRQHFGAILCGFAILMVVPLLFTLRAVAGERPSEVPLLPPGKAIERPLAGAGADHWRLELAAGRHWRVRVEQRGIDVEMEVKDPQGHILLTIDSPLGREGMESLLLTPAVDGTYHLTVRCDKRGVPDGRYEIHLDELSAVSAKDQLWLRAERAMTEAARLYPEMKNGGDNKDALPKMAMEELRTAHDAWRTLGEQQRQAQTLLLLGKYFDILNDYRQAVSSYDQALTLWRQVHHVQGIAATLDGLGLAHKNLGEYPQAVAYLEESLALRRTHGQQGQEATTRGLLCLAFHKSGQFRTAGACYEETLVLARKADDHQLEALMLNNLSGFYSNLGEPTKQLESLKQALELQEAMGDLFGKAITLNNLGAFHRHLGETEEALLFYTRGLKIFQDLGADLWEARVLNNLGFAYLTLGEFERARAYLLRALPLRRKVGDKAGENVTLVNLGRMYSGLGESGKALAFFKKSLDNNLEADNQRGATNARKLLGELHFERHEPDAARSVLELALASLQETGQRLQEAEVLELLSRVHLEIGKPLVAQELATRALGLHRTVRNPVGELQAQTTLAQVERALGNPGSARKHLEEALRTLEMLHGHLGDPNQRASFLASQRKVHELYVDFLMGLHWLAPSEGHDLEALKASERAHSRSLLTLLAETEVSHRYGVEPALRDRLLAAERRFTAKTQLQIEMLGQKHSPEEALRIEQDLYEALTALDNVRAEMRHHSPRYAALRHSPILDTLAIRALLDDQTAFLEFFLGEKRSFLWWVTPTSATAFELPPRAEVEDLARQTYQQVSTIQQDRGAARQALEALGQMLLGPVVDRLHGQRLVVVADGALHAIPFAALTLPRTNDPVLLRHEVVSLPSASVLALQRRQLVSWEKTPKTVAIFADPIFDPRDPRITGNLPKGTAEGLDNLDPITREGPHPGLEHLDRLPHTRREAEAIAALLPTNRRLVALDGEARRARVVGDELSPYRILHFATHGFFNPWTPELSGLMLSQFDAEGNEVDAFLGLYDVSNLELSAELVVLSGCRTTLGKEVRGEGLIGLPRGFMYAGVPRVVASLWQVRDEATARLMEEFYRAMLVAGLPPAAALRTAQLALRQERRWRDPFYWAAFALQGDWR